MPKNQVKSLSKVAKAVRPKSSALPQQGYQQVFKNMDDVLRKDAGCTSELDYTEQSSWLLFLKYLDALEQDREQEALLTGKKYDWILDAEYRWSSWAAPKNASGVVDHNATMTGDDLLEFVNGRPGPDGVVTGLFPYLRGFKTRATGPNTIEYKIGEIFGSPRVGVGDFCSCGELRRGQFDREAAAAEVDHRDDRFGRVVSIAAVVDETDLGVETLEF